MAGPAYATHMSLLQWHRKSSLRKIYKDIERERDRQELLRDDGKFENTPASQGVDDVECLAMIVEEVGECANDILENRREDLRTELIQVAALAVAWVERLDAELGL
jgi:hypothetical protein